VKGFRRLTRFNRLFGETGEAQWPVIDEAEKRVLRGYS
jgi:hypothetical protein